MAAQNPNPPVWHQAMSDGCSGVFDWLPFVGWMTGGCDPHDRAFHYGGGEAEFEQANQAFKDCIAAKRRCWLCSKVAWLVAHVRKGGVDAFGRQHFNWQGPGLPENRRP